MYTYIRIWTLTIMQETTFTRTTFVFRQYMFIFIWENRLRPRRTSGPFDETCLQHFKKQYQFETLLQANCMFICSLSMCFIWGCSFLFSYRFVEVLIICGSDYNSTNYNCKTHWYKQQQLILPLWQDRCFFLHVNNTRFGFLKC